jgi:hypothetical protein
MVRSDQTMPSWFSASWNLVASVSGRTHLLTAAKIHELLFDLPATARFAIVKDALNGRSEAVNAFGTGLNRIQGLSDPLSV